MTEWYYAKDGEKYGPVSTPQLKQLASAGHLQPDDLIWREGLDGWARASQAKGLFGGSKSPPPFHSADSPTNECEDPQATPFFASNYQDACPLCNRSHKGKVRELYGKKVCKKCYDSFINRRQFAFLVDYLLWQVAAFGLSAFLIGNFLTADSSIWFMRFTYFVLFFVFCMKDGFTGCSPGKALFGIQALMEDTGRPAGFGDSFGRNLCLIIPFMPLVVAIQLSKGYRTGDRCAKTKVIWKKYRDHPIFAVGQ
jgi:uncharacterized RDD family membrane protein YckC